MNFTRPNSQSALDMGRAGAHGGGKMLDTSFLRTNRFQRTVTSSRGLRVVVPMQKAVHRGDVSFLWRATC